MSGRNVALFTVDFLNIRQACSRVQGFEGMRRR